MTSGDAEHDGAPDGGPDAEHPPSTPEPEPLDIDRAFAEIVAAWSEESPTTWPADEDLTQGRHRRLDDPNRRTIEPPGRHQERDDDELSVAAGPLVPSVEPPEDGPEDAIGQADAFVPPEPPPLPRGDAITMLAWAGVILGPVVMLISVLWRHVPQLVVLFALAAFVGGFVVLVSRMPKHREDDDDDGAVV
jgi:hypothetical protein